MKITVIPNDPDVDVEQVLGRLATLPMPSAYSIYAGNRRDLVLEDEARIHFDAVVARFLHDEAIRFAWLVRRARRAVWA